MQTQTWFAAVGTDGMRPVVWGIGMTEDAALEDAGQQEGVTSADVAEMTTHPITVAQRAIIEAGDVSWPGAVRTYRLSMMTAVGWQSEPGRYQDLESAQAEASALIARGAPRVAIHDVAANLAVADLLNEGSTPSWYDRDIDLRFCPPLVGR